MRRNRKPGNFMFLAVLLLLLPARAGLFAAEPFTEKNGRFVMDLPAGWALQPQADEAVYVFKAGSDSIILQYFSGALGRAALFQNGIDAMRDSLPTAAAKGDVLDKKINGNPARWGIYKDALAVGKVKVDLYGLLGSVVLKKGGLYFLAIMNEKTLNEKQKLFETVFQSIRDVGGALSPAVDEGKAVAEPPVSEAALKEPLKFSRRNVSMVFPAGWVEKDKAGQFEEEFLGWFENPKVPGAVIIVYTYKGFTATQTAMRIRGLRTIGDALPLGQEALKEPKKIETAKGLDVKYELWRGQLKSGDAVVMKQAPLAIVKTDKGGWLMLLGFVPESSGPWLEDEVLKVLNTLE